MPTPGQEETVRVVALDRSFHLQCYRYYIISWYCLSLETASNSSVLDG